MKSIINKEVIFWDFDGVIVDSEEIRIFGFKKVLSNFPESQVKKLIDFHRANGGLSRYVKFRYFFNEIRNEEVTENLIDSLSDEFSAIMKKKLTSRKWLIKETLEFISKNYRDFKMFIVSGSDEKELKYLCEKLRIDKFFIKIKGSPTPKIDLVKNLIEENDFNTESCVLIGDSINDYEAARKNNIDFFGFNNPDLKKVSTKYISSFE